MVVAWRDGASFDDCDPLVGTAAGAAGATGLVVEAAGAGSSFLSDLRNVESRFMVEAATN